MRERERMYLYKVCYVISENEKLIYYNELLISLSSLRKQGFDGAVIILTDQTTAIEIERQKRCDHQELLAELRIVETPVSYSQKEKSRFLKTSMRAHISGDFLFLDTDTVIAGPMPESFDGELALALDYNTELKNRSCDIQRLIERNECYGYALDMDEPYFNSGCIWAKDTRMAHEFFHRWNNEWERCRERGFVLDQPSLNYVNWSMGGVVQELDGKFNAQILGCPTPINLLNDAKIIHYFNTGRMIYMLQKPEIKSLGYHSEAVQAIIASPKSAYLPCALIPLEEMTYLDELRFLKGTSILSALKKIYKHRWLFRGLNHSCSLFGKLHHMFGRRQVRS